MNPAASGRLPTIGSLPWGTHVCHFYVRREELVSALVPWFAAGLNNRERCLWVTADPLPADSARAELLRAVPDLDERIARGDIVIRDFDGWYTAGERPRGEAVVGRWLEAERRALADGYAGLRISGNVSFLTEEMRGTFLGYERAVTEAFRGRRILALCSFPLLRCPGADLFDVTQAHPCTLDLRNGAWELV